MKNHCALITGAGEGLGRSFAMGCAARGYDLLLISLPGSRLEKLSHHIENHYGVKVWFLEKNLCEKENLDEVIAFIDNNELPIQLLINNAGIGHTSRFDELSETHLHQQLTLNIEVLTQLIHSLIPLMQKVGDAQIINVGSMACFYSMPLKNSYAASKAYVLALSLALRLELAPLGISVSVVCPNGINTNVRQYMVYRQSDWITQWCFLDPDEVADYAIKKSLQGQAIIIPGRVNRVLRVLTSLMPPCLKRFIATLYFKPVKQFKAAEPRQSLAA